MAKLANMADIFFNKLNTFLQKCFHKYFDAEKYDESKRNWLFEVIAFKNRI